MLIKCACLFGLSNNEPIQIFDTDIFGSYIRGDLIIGICFRYIFMPIEISVQKILAHRWLGTEGPRLTRILGLGKTVLHEIRVSGTVVY